MGKIALFGAAGAIGKTIAAALRAGETPYRVVGRSRSALEATFSADPLAEIATWNSEDGASIRAAATGIEPSFTWSALLGFSAAPHPPPPDNSISQPNGCISFSTLLICNQRLRMNTGRIEKKILLRAPLERIWRALSDSTEFGTWFGMKFDGRFVPGAMVRGVIAPTKVNAEVGKAQKAHEGMPFEIVIEQMEPERLFSFRWHPFAIEPGVDYSAEPTTLVAFALEQVANGVMLTVTESGFDRIPLERRAKAFTANEQGWGMMVKVFEEYLGQAQ